MSTDDRYRLVQTLRVNGTPLATKDGVAIRLFRSQTKASTSALLAIGGREGGGLYAVGMATAGIPRVAPEGPGKLSVAGVRAHPIENEETGRLVYDYSQSITYDVKAGVVGQVTKLDTGFQNGTSSPAEIKPMTGPGPELLRHLSNIRSSGDMKGVEASLLEIEGDKGLHLHLLIAGYDDAGGYDLGIDAASVTSWTPSSDQTMVITTADAKYRVSFKSYGGEAPNTIEVKKL